MRKCGSIKLVVTILMAIAVTLFLPGLGLAGNLEPSGAPAPTMRTLDEIYSTNSWSQKLQCDMVETIHGLRPVCPRFEVLADFNSEAVLDMETGLVWEKSPSTSTFTWDDAQSHCNESTKGGRLGWRLPTMQELSSLVDPMQSNPALPSGHPFSNVQSSRYWSASTYAKNTYGAWLVNFVGVQVGLVSADIKGVSAYVWCVRGGQGYDAY